VFLLRFDSVIRRFPTETFSWVQGIVMTWAVLSLGWLAALAISRLFLRAHTRHSRARRNFLRVARGALFAAPAVAVGYGMFIQRLRMNLREQEIAIAGLPADLDGLKIVQLTDIHLSAFLSVTELERAVEIANETRPHLALVTGDLTTFKRDPLDDCLDRLKRLRADAGVFGCLGNHEIYTGSQDYVTFQGALFGMRILRQNNQVLRFGEARLNLAGVDYQRKEGPYLPDAEKLIEPGAFNVLLSHNPDVFPVAAKQGFQLTIAGHTHGGQVRVEILRQDLNIARFFTPYVDGLYRRDDAAVFVSRGIGTIGIPARLGSPPEVALLRLRRA
jgi:predicted MPP superfamily phosphohydrolase